MSETVEVVISKVLPAENNRPWAIFDGNDVKMNTFKNPIGELAENNIGRRMRVERHTEERMYNGRNYTNVYIDKLEGPLDDVDENGSNRPLRGETAPRDKLAIQAAVALRHAVGTLAHTVRTDSKAKEASEQILPLAEAYFSWLGQKSGDKPEDFPF